MQKCCRSYVENKKDLKLRTDTPKASNYVDRLSINWGLHVSLTALLSLSLTAPVSLGKKAKMPQNNPWNDCYLWWIIYWPFNGIRIRHIVHKSWHRFYQYCTTRLTYSLLDQSGWVCLSLFAVKRNLITPLNPVQQQIFTYQCGLPTLYIPLVWSVWF